jgi:hypothetical protein
MVIVFVERPVAQVVQSQAEDSYSFEEPERYYSEDN